MVESPPASARDVEGGYRLDVRDFGPIARAGVDLQLRGQARQITLIRCGQPLRGALRPEVT